MYRLRAFSPCSANEKSKLVSVDVNHDTLHRSAPRRRALRCARSRRIDSRYAWGGVTHTHTETWMLSHLVCTCNSREAICCVHPRVRHWSGNINRANAHTIRPCLCLCLLFMCTLRPPDPGEEGTIAEQEGKEEGTEAHARGSSGASRWPGTRVMGFCMC